MLSMSVKPDGQFKWILAEGESMDYPVPPTGNTNTHVKFQPNLKTFLRRWMSEGPTHHFALGIGHKADTIEKLAKVLNIECVRVTPPMH